jgi:hypothetical protein
VNDEELRAFLESASEGERDGKSDQVPAEQSQTAAAQDADGSASTDPEAAAPTQRKVPSFDELMNFRAPAEPEAQDAPAAASEAAGGTSPEQAQPSARGAELPGRGGAARRADDWSPAYAQEDEELVPLILPGFSPEPKQKRDLPPVFHTDQPGAAAGSGANDDVHVEPAPTQPFDVLPEESSGAGANSARTEAAPPVAAAPVAATKPSPVSAAAAVSRQDSAASRADSNDPFASLAPELAFDEVDDDEETDYEKISVTGSEHRGRKMLPWIIVGAGVIIAIIASIFVINGVRSDTTAPSETTSPSATTDPTTETPDEESAATEEPEAEPEPETAPEVDPGDTYALAITQWGITVDRSNSFGGSTPYELQDGNTKAMFELPLAQSLPESCAAARTGWGLLKAEDGTLSVIRPEPRCTDAEAAAVYDKIWGLMEHMAKSARAS